MALLKPHFDVVGSATDGARLVSEALRLFPDVIVTDITMPVMGGIEAAHQLREARSISQSRLPDNPFGRALRECVLG